MIKLTIQQSFSVIQNCINDWKSVKNKLFSKKSIILKTFNRREKLFIIFDNYGKIYAVVIVKNLILLYQ